MTRTQAIVFDMDGVLIGSEELHAHAKRIAFAHAGSALSDADLRSYVGRSDAVMIDEIGARYGLSAGCCVSALTQTFVARELLGVGADIFEDFQSLEGLLRSRSTAVRIGSLRA
jgi:beta-phosphoglucomutase-like phosphatase (HAD superfamily)